MADILAALDQLEQESKKPTRRKSTRSVASATAAATRQNSRRTPRAQTRSPPRSAHIRQSSAQYLQPPQSPGTPRSTYSSYAPSARSQSIGGESRRSIAFGDTPRPTTRRTVTIATTKDALSSGFSYDAVKLLKYGISAKTWSLFSDQIVVAADVSHYNSLSWIINRKKIIDKIRKDLQYEGPVKKKMRIWNRVFKDLGCHATLMLPDDNWDEADADSWDTKEERAVARKEVKKFRVVVNPLADKGSSIYSRTSSLTRSVTGEGAKTLKSRLPPPPATPETKFEGEGDTVGAQGENDSRDDSREAERGTDGVEGHKDEGNAEGVAERIDDLKEAEGTTNRAEEENSVAEEGAKQTEDRPA